MGRGIYLPTLTEWLITLSCFSGMILLYVLFTRYFPIIPIWETAEEVAEAAAPEGEKGMAVGD
jgi:Ni/Fe-hydrogenase subunit HybB-like protein